MLDWKWKFPCLTDQDNEEIYLFRAKRDYQPRDTFAIAFNEILGKEKILSRSGLKPFVLLFSKRECYRTGRKMFDLELYLFLLYRVVDIERTIAYTKHLIPSFANVSQLFSTTSLFYEFILRSVNLGTKNIFVVSPAKLPSVCLYLPH